MKRILSITLLLLLLTGCSAREYVPVVTGPQVTTPTATTAPPSSLPTAPAVRNGWLEEDGQRYFYVQDMPLTGWQQLDSTWYYFGETGAMHTGFLEDDGKTYYFREDGTMATGEVLVDGKAYHFTADGQRILLVNPWNYVPEDYTPVLVELSTAIAVENMLVDVQCYDALMAMLEECNRVCPYVCVVSSYRTHAYQEGLFENKIQRVMAATNLGREEATVLAAQEVARPGTSEHQLGLAVDIVDTRDWSLEAIQAELPAQQWLMANSWRFGFVLRYPADKIDVTGIIYEPWHYRYVGKDLAAYLFENDLTLEEYLAALTTTGE